MATCTLCGRDASRRALLPPTVFDGHRFDYYACDACGARFVHPLPTPATLLKMYSTSYHGDAGDALEAQTPRDDRAYDALVARLARHLPPPARVLDYGCGAGAFVAAARARGYRADGAEFNPDYVEVLKQRHPAGSSFFHVDALDAVAPGAYDALVLSNVLEHLTAPRETFRRALRLVKPGGVVYSFGPVENNPSLVWAAMTLTNGLKAVLRPGYAASHPPVHLTFATRQGQRAFFAEHGLRELDFSVADEVWPYPRAWRDAAGGAAKIKWGIGLASRGLSALLPWMGNTFFYVGRVPAASAAASATDRAARAAPPGTP